MRKLSYLSLRTKGLFFRCFKQKKFLLLTVVGAIILVTLFQWGLICSNVQPMKHIQKVCVSYGSSESVGNLCRELCHPHGASPVSCHSYKEKQAAFYGKWRNSSLFFKKVNEIPQQFNRKQPTEADFVKMIQSLVKSKFNIVLSDVDANGISHLRTHDGFQRRAEMENIWTLLQDNEYLAMTLYRKYNIFPTIVGSCGSLFAVEKLGSIPGYWHLVTLYDSQKEWNMRVRISISILDFLQKLEFGVPEPIHICDVKIRHFGVNDTSKKVMYLDLDAVHPFTITNKYTADGSACKHHSDCDYHDCRSLCNLITFKCQLGVVNNNLQIVCEKIFLGWVMSGRLMVPGLLLGPRSPRVLVDLLEQCANPSSESGTPRSPATKEVRKRLYNLLTQLAVP